VCSLRRFSLLMVAVWLRSRATAPGHYDREQW
jgi:hypothetical protein